MYLNFFSCVAVVLFVLIGNKASSTGAIAVVAANADASDDDDPAVVVSMTDQKPEESICSSSQQADEDNANVNECVPVDAVTEESDEHHDDNYDHDLYDQSAVDCGIYLAPSTIPNAGLGMFNGNRYIQTRQPIGPGDTIVPLHDYTQHNPHLHEKEYFFGSYGWSTEL